VARSVENSIATGDFELVVGAKKTVKLKKYVFDDGHIVCNGAGSDCKVKVGVDSVVPMQNDSVFARRRPELPRAGPLRELVGVLKGRYYQSTK
jgi:hypothetical protein